jgi:WD40 repeat protein
MPNQPRNLRAVREINRRDILFSVARVPNSERLIVASSAGKVFELDASQNNPQERELANHGRYVTSVRLVQGKVISGGYDGRLIWWDLERNQAIRTVEAHDRWIRHIAVAPDGSKIASVADDMVCRIWNVQTGERLHELRGHEAQTPSHFDSMLYVCRFSPDGRHLATADRVGHIVVWEVATGRQVASMDAPELYTWDGRQRIRSMGGVRGLAFSPNGEHLAASGVGQIGNVDSLAGPSRVEVFHWSRGERLFLFTGDQGIVNRIDYHPENRWIFAIGGKNNGIVMFYDPQGREMIHRQNMPMHVHDAAFNEDHSRFYAVGHNKIAVMELDNG